VQPQLPFERQQGSLPIRQKRWQLQLGALLLPELPATLLPPLPAAGGLAPPAPLCPAAPTPAEPVPALTARVPAVEPLPAFALVPAMARTPALPPLPALVDTPLAPAANAPATPLNVPALILVAAPAAPALIGVPGHAMQVEYAAFVGELALALHTLMPSVVPSGHAHGDLSPGALHASPVNRGLPASAITEARSTCSSGVLSKPVAQPARLSASHASHAASLGRRRSRPSGKVDSV
jgi:hypothetical protein